MARLTKADAARQLGISRTTLYKLIAQGQVSTTAEGLVDTAELGRIASTLDVHPGRPVTPVDTTRVHTDLQGDAHRERPISGHTERRDHAHDARQLTSSYRDMLDIFREQVHAAQERERAYQEHIAQLTLMLDQAHQQNQRLLDMPRPLAAAPRAPGASVPSGAGAGLPRGAMRQRILALLVDYPEGLTPTEMRTLLRAGKRLANTCLAMRRDGLLERVGPGRYVVREASTSTP